MVKELVEKIKKANDAYRVGKPIISDAQYDILVDELTQIDPHNDILNQIGHKIQDESRKKKLPIKMASMSKVKSVKEILDWVRIKGIDSNEDIIITPKYDGLSLCVNELTGEAFTRGDGIMGQSSNEHYKLIGNHYEGESIFNYTYGEVMIPKSVFISNYSNDFANPRNLVAGLLNSKDINPYLKDCQFIKYGGILLESIDFMSKKSDILDHLNSGQDSKVNYKVVQIKDINEDFLNELFMAWSKDYEIDGLVLEVDSIDIQTKLGRETSSGNPVWARAYKSPKFEQVAESEVLGISWNISKQGLIKPILHIKPVKLDGVTVSNVTGNNARFVKDMGLGKGAIVKVKRSGMVIPIISDVIKSVEFTLPDIPNIGWNPNGIELVTLSETDDQKFKQLVSFFQILETDNVSEGVIKQLWNAGFKTVSDILKLSVSDLQQIDRFGKRKAAIVFDAIHKVVGGVQLSKIQHASGLFPGLGSRKLILLEHFKSKPTIDQVMSIEGFAEISAKSYIDNYDRFFEFVKDLPIKIIESIEPQNSGGDMEGLSFVFTGVRRSDLEELIQSRGGKIGGSVSKNTTHLVMKEVGSGSSKEKKALDLGIKIITVSELENLLK